MDDLGSQERAILDMIAANPFVSQQELADALEIARSTIASHITHLTRKGFILGRGYVLPSDRRIFCVGGAVLDRKYRARAAIVPHTSNPVDGFRSYGGVARNVAENLIKLGVTTGFATIVGNDETGRDLLMHLRQLGVDVSQAIVSPDLPTAEYVALLGPDNNLSVAAADMRILEQMDEAFLDQIWPHLASADWVFADCNLSAQVLSALIERARSARFRLAIDAVSTPKVVKLPPHLDGVDVLFLNLDEATAFLQSRGPLPDQTASAVTAALKDRKTALTAALNMRLSGAAHVVVTLGADGLAIASPAGQTHLEAVPASPLDTTGAGDAMIAATLFRLRAGDGVIDAARYGALSGALATETSSTVHPMLSPEFLEANRFRLAQQPV